jgi:hypothetical protein
MASTYTPQATTTQSQATPAIITVAMVSTYTPQATTQSPATPATTMNMVSAYTPQATTHSPATPATITIAMVST